MALTPLNWGGFFFHPEHSIRINENCVYSTQLICIKIEARLCTKCETIIQQNIINKARKKIEHLQFNLIMWKHKYQKHQRHKPEKKHTTKTTTKYQQRQLQKHFAKSFLRKFRDRLILIRLLHRIDKTDPKILIILFKWCLTSKRKFMCSQTLNADEDTDTKRIWENKQNNNKKLSRLNRLFCSVICCWYEWKIQIWLFNFKQHFHFVLFDRYRRGENKHRLFFVFFAFVTILSNSI